MKAALSQLKAVPSQPKAVPNRLKAVPSRLKTIPNRLKAVPSQLKAEATHQVIPQVKLVAVTETLTLQMRTARLIIAAIHRPAMVFLLSLLWQYCPER